MLRTSRIELIQFVQSHSSDRATRARTTRRTTIAFSTVRSDGVCAHLSLETLTTTSSQDLEHHCRYCDQAPEETHRGVQEEVVEGVDRRRPRAARAGSLRRATEDEASREYVSRSSPLRGARDVVDPSVAPSKVETDEDIVLTIMRERGSGSDIELVDRWHEEFRAAAKSGRASGTTKFEDVKNLLA